MKRLEVDLACDWDAIKRVWDPVVDHLTGSGLDADTAYLLSMSAQELLENAVKYGGRVTREPSIKLTVDVGPREVTIEVTGPAAPPEKLKKLDEAIQWIRGFQDPFEAYVERLKQVSAMPYANGESGLGLTRIAYEGGCVLDFYVDDADQLSISAVYQPLRHTRATQEGTGTIAQ
jgi:hypothetical protein